MSLIPVEYINPFYQAVQRICGETANVPVTTGKPRLLKPTERIWKLFGISAVIRLDSAVRGLVSLSFCESVALALASGLAQQTFEKLDADALDALGEVANLIVGTAKRDLPGELVTISTPQILATHRIEFPAGLPTVLIPFESSPGRFMMQLSMTRAAAAAVAVRQAA